MGAELMARAKTHLEKELPFVLYRKPEQNILNAIFQYDNSLNEVVDYTERGFVFAPFLDIKNPVLLKADEVSKAALDVVVSEKVRFMQQALDNSNEKERYSNLIDKAIS